MKKLMIKLIKAYQKNYPYRGRCRYNPTCSQYALEAYQNFNFFYATFLTIKRILKCNPLFKGGYDPLPIKKSKKPRK
ncbi:MAG TPA: membrane protein insertion efficiency factor YidD [Acholeplasmataceae bacterium]|nr:membrane protein insertion efficiency factor YidD [Acholeplasmataceae bacterium]